MKTFDIITTERLHLRKLDAAAYQYIFALTDDAVVMELLGLNTPAALAEEREKYRQGFTTFNRSLVQFQLLDKHTQAVIGLCGYHTWYPAHFRAEIGYAVTDEPYKGKGIMSEALKPIIQYGFEQMALNRIEAFIGPQNIASRKLVEKFHFVQEGEMREHYCKNNILENAVVYSLLKKEYSQFYQD
ncbi:GNAT family N-acetyltransferase [Chitinophaga nivalis]|uniref:GNAT family N-acetyltransferase n=1 Tax=Chitinophaga nivalis TaxID=2991709 RepID=A0ABT3IKI0_9BACT|nr:GNAT family protein [Chitinophaga nivalis]MCW3465846.1 GNAT family N-acetyltransferase [Chitinophaga nivalis]MCW3484463.1 GNAT family N-acetyltransferase [Chitinophaga nivalis]